MLRRFVCCLLFIFGMSAGLKFSFKHLPSTPRQIASVKPAPFVIAERGDVQKYVENTTEALVSGARSGADYVEIDVRRTRDKVFVVHNDEQTGRVTICDGDELVIKTSTWDQLQKQCRYPHTSAASEKILKLSEALALLKNEKAGLVLDVKPEIAEEDMIDLGKELLKLDPAQKCREGVDPGGTFDCFKKIIIYVNNIPAHNKLWRLSLGTEGKDDAFKILKNMKFLKMVSDAKEATDKPGYYLDTDGVAFDLMHSSYTDVQNLQRKYPYKMLVGWTLATHAQWEEANALYLSGVTTNHIRDFISYKKRH